MFGKEQCANMACERGTDTFSATVVLGTPEPWPRRLISDLSSQHSTINSQLCRFILLNSYFPCWLSAPCHSSRFHESAHRAFDLFWRRRPIANTDSDDRSSMPG